MEYSKNANGRSAGSPGQPVLFFVQVNSAILVSITVNSFDVVYSPAANCILATFYIAVYM